MWKTRQSRNTQFFPTSFPPLLHSVLLATRKIFDEFPPLPRQPPMGWGAEGGFISHRFICTNFTTIYYLIGGGRYRTVGREKRFDFSPKLKETQKYFEKCQTRGSRTGLPTHTRETPVRNWPVSDGDPSGSCPTFSRFA